ncbi:MFS transporter [Streptomyces sp. NPDC093589]|uniref:MFS transporter n=1 Tax=Streptomyces sp. NPDC093589 TaxID=3366043 RepID=UPI00382D0EC9
MPSFPDRVVMQTSFMRGSDALATSITTIAIPLLVLTTTGSAALTGLAFVLEWLPRLLAFSIGGPLVDRFGADRVFRLATAARATLLAAAGGVLSDLPATGTATTAVVMTIGALSGLLSQSSFVAVETFGAAASRAAGNQAHRVQSVQISIDQGALLIGPLLAGLLLTQGPVVMLLVAAGLSTAAACSTIRCDDTLSPAGVSGPFMVLSGLRSGWRTVRSVPALGWLVLGLVASNLALAVTQASSPITVLHHFGGSSLTAGAVWSAAGVVSLAAVAASRRAIDRFGLWSVGATGAVMACSACLAVGFAPALDLYAVTIGVLMAGEGALTVVLRTLRARLIPASAFGSALSVTIVLVVIPMPVAGALVAALPAPALPTLLLSCAVLQGLAMTAAFRGLWRHRSSYATPASQPTAAPCEAHPHDTAPPTKGDLTAPQNAADTPLSTLR